MRQRAAKAPVIADAPGGEQDARARRHLLAHGVVVWLSNIITFGLLFWQLGAST